MRVILTSHFPLTGSGSGTYTLNIAHALVKKGHEVRIIVPENQEPEQYDDFEVCPIYFNGFNDQALPFNFPCFTTHPRSLQTFYDLTDDEIDQYEQAFRAELERQIEDFKPDVIHCGHAWLMPAYAVDYDVPVVITVHGTDLFGYSKTERFHDLVAHAVDKCAAIVTISKENDALVHELFPAQADKCYLIPNGYNSDVFYPQPTTRQEALDLFGIDGEFEHIVSFAGKFANFKGIDILLRGAALYERPDTVTILAGDGELFDDMNALADELGLENVYFVRNQPHDKLRRLYSAADVSLLTSRKEPFGLVIIEAMACGTPVIGSDDGGAVDIITPEVGLLFESENPEALAEQVKKVLDGEVSFDRDVIAEYAKENYSQDKRIGTLIDIYEDAI